MDVGYAETQKYNVYALDLPFLLNRVIITCATSKRISQMGMDYEQSRQTESSKWNLMQLAGLPDLKGSGGFYDPLGGTKLYY